LEIFGICPTVYQQLHAYRYPNVQVQSQLIVTRKPVRSEEWSNIVDKDSQNSLILTNTYIKNRLLDCSSKGSGYWLNVMPSSPLGLKLSNEQMRIACSLRLGIPVSYPPILNFDFSFVSVS